MHYRFYFMTGQRIMQAEDRDCADDGEARSAGEDTLARAEAPFDALEVWRGAVRVCRHERSSLRQRC